MDRLPVIGVVGGADVDEDVHEQAYQVGRRIAEQGWVLMNGGRDVGVMEAASRGARQASGTVIGILPMADAAAEGVSEELTHRIATGLGEGRNLVNVYSSDAIVACRGGAGTLSEVALAVKTGTLVALVGWPDEEIPEQLRGDGLVEASSPRTAVEAVQDEVEP